MDALSLDFTVLLLLIPLLGVLIAYLHLRFKHLQTTVNEEILDKVVMRISLPANDEKTPASAEQLYASLYGILRGGKKSANHFSFEIAAGSYGIYFLIVVSQRYQQFVENQIYAQYPAAEIKIIQDYAQSALNTSNKMATVEIALKKEFYLPIKTFANFDVDPLASIASTISKLQAEQEVFMQFVVRPIDNTWQKTGQVFVNAKQSKTDAEGKKVGLEAGEAAILKEVENKSSKLGFQFLIRVIALASDSLTAERILEDVEASLKQFETSQYNGLAKVKKPKNDLANFLFGARRSETLSVLSKYLLRMLDERTNQIINIEELASLYHLPNQTVQVPKIAWSRSRKLPYPMNVAGPEDGARIMGVTDYRNHHQQFGLKEMDRRRHMYVLGKTGTGKSTLLKNLIMGDIYDGKGIGVIDPHGDLIEEILGLIPDYRMNDVVILDPSDTAFPIGLNILKIKEGEEKDIVADGIVSIFKKYFGDSWGPRLQYLLTNAIVTLLQAQNVSLLAITRLLEERNYRRFIVKQLKDPILRKFWDVEYENLAKNAKEFGMVLSPIQNKVGRFVSTQIIRNIVGQVRSTIDLEDIMNNSKIFLVNLSQGKIGEENSALLGGMLITRIYTNAMQRVKIEESKRTNFYLYVDEFQNFATETFVKILSEARKYGLNLIVAHQYIDQLLPEVRDAIFGNVGTMLNYVVGPRDGAELEKEYKPHLTSEDLVNLEKYRFVCKVTIDGTQSPPFTGIALPPSWEPQNNKDAIIAASREAYALPRDVVDDKINRWAESKYDDQGVLVQAPMAGGNSSKDGGYATSPSSTYTSTATSAPTAAAHPPATYVPPRPAPKPAVQAAPAPVSNPAPAAMPRPVISPNPAPRQENRQENRGEHRPNFQNNRNNNSNQGKKLFKFDRKPEAVQQTPSAPAPVAPAVAPAVPQAQQQPSAQQQPTAPSQSSGQSMREI